MSIFIIERENSYLLGAEDRADQLLEWSSKGEPGQRSVKDFPFGLRLGFVRDGFTPKIYIHWNQHKFNEFLKGVGTCEEFSVTAFGIRVDKRNGSTIVRLLGGGQTTQTLWDSEAIEFSRQQEASDVNWLVGMVKLSENGPEFFTTPESQLELEESSAVAIISNKPAAVPVVKAKTAGAVIAKKTELSPQARSFLLQDIAINALLGRIAK